MAHWKYELTTPQPPPLWKQVIEILYLLVKGATPCFFNYLKKKKCYYYDYFYDIDNVIKFRNTFTVEFPYANAKDMEIITMINFHI